MFYFLSFFGYLVFVGELKWSSVKLILIKSKKGNKIKCTPKIIYLVVMMTSIT